MSAFVWIDHSEKQRRQILDAVDQFRDKDTRDELGIAGIRDAFSDMLFPGTGSLQRRARYFFFVPWMYQKFEERKVSSSELTRQARTFEIKLIDALADSSDPSGTIGILARSSLQRVPSNIYWNGLKVLGICQFAGSQADYHRSFDRRTTASAAIRRNDDGEIIAGLAPAWHNALPEPPEGFPSKAEFALTPSEARYLKSRVFAKHRDSFFAFLLDRDDSGFKTDFAWDHPASEKVPTELRRQLDHARCFSEVMHGASILYNLFLAELQPRRDVVVTECEALLSTWLDLIAERRSVLNAWDRADFWNRLLTRGYKPSHWTRAFVDEWSNRVTDGDPSRLRSLDSTRRLIFDREQQIKGPLARCNNSRSREMWGGDSGLGRLDFRWFNARMLLTDIAAALGNNHA